ncbi:MAG: hypothetical protein ACRCVT_00805 [Leadbetterella sp.]
MLKIIRLLLILPILTSLGYSQKLDISSEVFVLSSTSGKTDLFQRWKKDGVVGSESNVLVIRPFFFKDYDSTYNIVKSRLRKFDYSFGFQPSFSVGKVNRIQINQVFGKVRFKSFEIMLGRVSRTLDIFDTQENSENFIQSQNAIPIPKFEISIPNYTSILGKGMISVKGNFAHGWFGKQEFTKDYFLHQKSLYGKIGRNSSKIQFVAGFNNQIQWGGYSERLKNDTLSSIEGYLPSGFNYFVNTAFPFGFVSKIFPDNNTLFYDVANYGGNVLGSVDFGIKWKIKGLNILFYRQIPYDLGSLFSSLVNADDGIYGLNFDLRGKNYFLKQLKIEGIHTYNQGYYRSGIARTLNLADRHNKELHGYLNHGQYADGWSYQGQGIGTPFILDKQFVNSQYLPEKQENFAYFNQVKGIYLASDVMKFNYSFKTKVFFGNYRQTGGPYWPNNNDISQFFIVQGIQKDIFLNQTLGVEISYQNQGIVTTSTGLSIRYVRIWR